VQEKEFMNVQRWGNIFNSGTEKVLCRTTDRYYFRVAYFGSRLTITSNQGWRSSEGNIREHEI